MNQLKDDQGFIRGMLTGNNTVMLIVGSVGSGKSILVNSIAWQMKHFNKYKIIYVTEKNDSPLENAFCGIASDSSWQKRMLESSMLTGSRTIDKEDIEIYHPFTFNFPKSRVPDCMHLFTMPISEINDLSFSVLMGRDIDSPTVKICQEVKNSLKKEDDIYSFVFKVFEKSSLSKEEHGVKFSQKSSVDSMLLPIESYGSKREVEQVKSGMSDLNEHWFLQDDECELNLTEKKLAEILNNNKTTFFTMWKLNNEKLQYFTYIDLLFKIRKLIGEHKCKREILIILEEIKILLPKTANLDYEKKLISILRKMLAGLRSSGVTILATTQSYFETNSEFRDGVHKDQVFLMSLSMEDIKSFSSNFSISIANQTMLSSLKTGEVIMASQLFERFDDPTVLKCFYVPFAHRERKMSPFVDYWKERYPDNCISYKDILEEMSKKQKECQKMQIERTENFVKKLEERKQKKAEEKEKKLEELMLRSELSQRGQTAEQQTMQTTPKKRQRKNYQFDEVTQELIEPEKTAEEKREAGICSFIKSTPDADWGSRGMLLGKSPIDLEKEAVGEALKNKDFEFIKRFSSRKFIKDNFPDKEQEVFK